jgi:hypothetical protein
MKADRIDVLVEDFGEEVLLGLRGTFGLRQLASVREKLEMLVEGPGKIWFFDLEHSRFLEPVYLDLFLDLLNRIKGKGGLMVLLFQNAENFQFFERFRNVFDVHPSRDHYHQSGLFNRLRQTGVVYSRRTGLRLSPGVAIVLVVLLAGWMLTLFSIIHYQETEIRNRESRILALENLKREYSREISELRAAIGPLRDLGVIVDSTGMRTLGSLNDWTVYLEKMEAKRRGQ